MKAEYFLGGMIFLMLCMALFFLLDMLYFGPKRIRNFSKPKLSAPMEPAEAYQRRVFPVLNSTPYPACGLAPAIQNRLEMSQSLTPYPGPLMACKILLDGEVVHGPLGSWLKHTEGVHVRRLADLEKVASRQPHKEWLIKFIEPLQSRVYQRHADGSWNLVQVGTGMF